MEEIATDWGVMGYLLQEDGTAIDETLVSLAQDGVEGFGHAYYHYCSGNLEQNCRFDSFLCGSFDDFFKEYWGKAKISRYTLKMRFLLENSYWKRYIQYIFSFDNISANLLKNILKNFFLLIYLFLIYA